MGSEARKVALVTGGSRGVGAATAVALADVGYDVALVYRNKAARAAEVAVDLAQRGARALPLACDITDPEQVARAFSALRDWGGRLDALVLCASGGLERELAGDPLYPMRMNHDAQLMLLDAALPLMPPGSVVVFVTSHWAHLDGQVDVGPLYAPVDALYKPVARAKRAGELALRAREAELAAHGLRLVVVSVDMIEGTIMLKLFERMFPAFIRARRAQLGRLPSAAEVGQTIATAAADGSQPAGCTIVVGGDLDTMPLAVSS